MLDLLHDSAILIVYQLNIRLHGASRVINRGVEAISQLCHVLCFIILAITVIKVILNYIIMTIIKYKQGNISVKLSGSHLIS